MTETKLITGIDIGTTLIRVIIAESDGAGKPVYLGHGAAPSHGLKRGVVINMEKAVESISRAVEDAELMAGEHIDSAAVSITGDHIKSINSHGVDAVSGSENEITERDIKRAVEAASAVAIPPDREIIHILPQEYTVDEQSGIKNPIGMSGVRLEVEVHIVTAALTSTKNIYRCLERCEINIDHIVLQSLASSQANITEQDQELGVALIDIGGELTDIAVFFDGSIRHTGVVPLGGKNVTNDITIGLRTTLNQAEQLKLAYGSALISMVDPDEMMEVGGATDRSARKISRNVLASIIEPRMEEILSLAAREIKKANPPETLTAGVLLSGGGSLLPGSVELAEQIFDMPCRLAVPSGLEGLPENVISTDFATAVGLVLYGARSGPARNIARGGLKKFFRKIESWFSDNF
jgi:cell division protein FtsA